MSFNLNNRIVRYAAVGVIAVSVGLVLAIAHHSWRLDRGLMTMRDGRRESDIRELIAAAVRDRAVGFRFLSTVQEAPVIIHPTFSQVIVSDHADVVCDDPAKRPSCPGQILDTGGHDTKCVADLGPLFAGLGSIPSEPSAGDGKNLVNSLPLGPENSEYYIHMTAGNRIEIGACWPEIRSEIRLKQ